MTGKISHRCELERQIDAESAINSVNFSIMPCASRRVKTGPAGQVAGERWEEEEKDCVIPGQPRPVWDQKWGRSAGCWRSRSRWARRPTRIPAGWGTSCQWTRPAVDAKWRGDPWRSPQPSPGAPLSRTFCCCEQINQAYVRNTL